MKNAIIASMKDKPVKTISFDNGPEFSQYRAVEAQLHSTIYFAEPHSPWQRGTNENTNGILRFFFPKKFDISSFPPDFLQTVVDLINHRPRKCLDWLSPHDLFFSSCCT